MNNPDKFTTIRAHIGRCLAQKAVLISDREKCETRLTGLQDEASGLDKAKVFAQDLAKSIQEKAHEKVSKVVTRCLESVFDEPYTFRIAFEQKRGKTEARLVFERDGEEFDPMEETGGGCVDIAAFALRLSALALSKPKARRLLVMDEPFRFVSEEFRPQVKNLIENLSDEFNTQFILVTHMKELRTGTIVQF